MKSGQKHHKSFWDDKTKAGMLCTLMATTPVMSKFKNVNPMTL